MHFPLSFHHLQHLSVWSFLFVAVITASCGETITPETSRAELTKGEISFNPDLAGVHPRLVVSPEQLQAAAAEWRKDPAKYASLADQRGFPELPVVRMDVGINGWHNPRRVLHCAALYLVAGEESQAAILHRWIQNSYAPGFGENPSPVVIPGLGTDNKDLGAGGILFSTALLYDLLAGNKAYNEKYPGDLDILKKVLLIQGAQSYEDLTRIRGLWYEQNHFYIVAAGLGLTSLALADEVDEHPEILQWAVWSRNAMRRTAETLSSDGFYYESIGYWSGFFHYASAYAEALRRMTGEDLLKTGPNGRPGLLTGLDKYLAHIKLPEPGKFFPYADHGPREPYRGYRSFMSELEVALSLYPLLQLSEVAPSPLVTASIAWEWNARDSFRRAYIDAMEASLVLLRLPLLAENLQQEVKLADEPTGYYFPDHEVITWRNAWTASEDGSGMAFFYKAGPPKGHQAAELLKKYPDWKMGLGHVHPDAGTFQIYSKGGYLATGPGYSGKKKTEHQNCVLIDGKGQFKEGGTWDTFAAAPYSKYDKMRFQDVWVASQVAAGTADIAAAYDDTLQLEHYRRQLILVGGRWLVVRDSIAAPKDHTYTWVLNSDRPFLPLEKPEDNRWWTECGGSRLVVQSLTPVAESRTGPTLVDVDLSGKRPEPVVRSQHLQLDLPPSAQGEFLNVLSIQDRKKDSIKEFTARNAGDGLVEIQDGKDRCSVYLGAGEKLEGSYAYFWSSEEGKKISLGFSGSRFTLPDGKILSLNAPGSVAATRKAGRWEIEGNLEKAGVLTLEGGDGKSASIELPAGISKLLADLPL